MSALADFAETRLNLGISGAYGAVGGPQYQTTVVVVNSGHEYRNSTWARSRGHWQLGERMLNKAEIDYFLAFFRARRGRAQGFRYRDWADFQALGQPIGVGDGATLAFQLSKTYASGAVSYVRMLTKPVAGTVQVYLNGSQQLSGWTVDTASGVITFTQAPAAGAAITADCEFDVPVRFDVDKFDAEFRAYRDGDGQRLFWLYSLPITEIRP